MPDGAWNRFLAYATEDGIAKGRKCENPKSAQAGGKADRRIATLATVLG